MVLYIKFQYHSFVLLLITRVFGFHFSNILCSLSNFTVNTINCIA